MADGEVSLSVVVSNHISAAFHQNSVPTIREITVENGTDRDLVDLEIEVASEPEFAAPLKVRIDRIPPKSTQHVRSPNLPLSIAFLRKLTEAVHGELRFTLKERGAELAADVKSIHLLPPSHWGGTGSAPELLAAFVRPNDPAVDVVLREAGLKLAAAGKPNAIDGYTSGRRDRAWELAAAIWSVLAAKRLTYVLPPKSFERQGQKVRSPSEILEKRVGTCLDITLLYAAALEQAGLNPMIVLTEGHAFVGVFLRREELPMAVVDDVQTLRKRRDADESIFIETTYLTHTPPGRFGDAVRKGASHIEEGAEAPLEVAVDVSRARTAQIRPLDLGDGPASVPVPGVDGPELDLGIEDAPTFPEDIVVREIEDQNVDRLERWKRKLLDLTLRNKMLNFKDGAKSVRIECPEPHTLEDALSSGRRFKVLPKSDVLGDGDPRDAKLHEERTNADARRQVAMDAIARNELHSTLEEKDLNARLTDLYRVTRTAFEEGGSNILFLAMGFLRWRQDEKGKGQELKAPLLLIPVSLERSSVRAGFRLALHEDEIRFNPTLLEMLRQDFNLRMVELEGELPTDGSGIDVAKVWSIVRAHVRDVRGWEVTPEVVLSTFSFTKFLMWRDLVERMHLLKQNSVVRHLVDTPKHSYGDDRPFPSPYRLDYERHPSEVFAPLSADSSQLAAVFAAAGGKDFVLHGPPGTGKSQTITNMISQLLAMGRKVLFVSQKTAALEVVRRRLVDIELGDYCLEVHSSKAQKSAILEQLKTSWHSRSAPDAREWKEATEELSELRGELNALVAALHTRRSNGSSAYQTFGIVVAHRGRFEDVVFDWPDAAHDEAFLVNLRKTCRDLSTALRAAGDPSEHPLRGIRALEWSPGWRTELTAALDALTQALAPLRDSTHRIGDAIALPRAGSYTAMRAVALLTALLTRPEARKAARCIAADQAAVRSAIEDLQSLKSKATEIQGALSGAYSATVFKEDLRAFLADWRTASEANFLFRGSRQNKVRQALQPFATSQVPTDLGVELVKMLDLKEVRALAERLRDTFVAVGASWDGIDTDSAEVESWLEWAVHARKVSSLAADALGLDRSQMLEHVQGLLADHTLWELGGAGAEAAGSFLSAWEAATSALTAAARLVSLGEGPVPFVEGPDWIEETVAVAARWRANLGRAQEWCFWNKSGSQATELGLGPLVAAIGRGTVGLEEAATAFEAAYARWWADRIVDGDAVLRSFVPARHEDAISRFRAADERVVELSKRIIKAHLSGDIPPPNAFGADAEWGTLVREISKRARHMPVRRLFSEIPSVLTKLTPCVMMSPLSIAQYLPPDASPFDVVIFDEASQIPVWDAIGAIARGKQVIIVGDPEQLPPTSVGERGVDEIEDGTDVEDQESILDECLAANIPQIRLDWHYRSKHESLIAFSNKHYYRGELVTFPSPLTADQAVRYVHVPGGVYERGKGRVNQEEAKAVVADVVRRLKAPSFREWKQSLGVVTFNAEQQRLVENLLDQERRANPELEDFFDRTRWHEPVFIKNLENVQGDERDVILFTVAVAPDQAGRGVATISSLNKEGGYRRLNVAITRARQEMVVFATLKPDQIDLSRTNARAIRDFKHFLEFAERGPRAMAEAFAPTGRDIESPFEDAVKKALENRGWEVHTQIGASKFRVDLAVVHPDAPGRYLAGIECDGATYHRSATARDRDRLREHILSKLGWRIRRVWSTEWWMDAERAFDTLHAKLMADLENDRSASKAEEPILASQSSSEGDVAPTPDLESIDAEPASRDTRVDAAPPVADQTMPAAPDQDNQAPEEQRIYARRAAEPSDDIIICPAPEGIYVPAMVADSGHTPDGDRFYDAAYRPGLREMVRHVIRTEGPIFDDVLVQRLARAHGFQRAAGKIREIVLGVVPESIERTNEDGRIVFWPEDADPGRPFPLRRSEPDVRTHGDIPIHELASLAASLASDEDEEEIVIRLMAERFGLSRIKQGTRARFEAALRLARGSA
jgi:very-short-patch-repair endonuclease